MGGRQSSDQKSFMVYVETNEGKIQGILTKGKGSLRLTSLVVQLVLYNDK